MDSDDRRKRNCSARPCTHKLGSESNGCSMSAFRPKRAFVALLCVGAGLLLQSRKSRYPDRYPHRLVRRYNVEWGRLLLLKIWTCAWPLGLSSIHGQVFGTSSPTETTYMFRGVDRARPR